MIIDIGVNDLKIVKARPEDQKELLYLYDEYILKHRFGCDWKTWAYHIFGDREIDWHKGCLLIKHQGRIIATVTVIPMVLKVAGIPVEVGVITGVVTLPEFRRQGMMVRLMQRANDMMREDKQPIGLLWGYRDRYRHFGFELGGKHTRYFIPRRKFRDATEAEKQKIREIRLPEDKKFIQGLTDVRNLYLKDSAEYHVRVFNRGIARSYIFDDLSHPAIVTINISPLLDAKYLEVHYANGRFEEILIVLNWLMSNSKCSECVFIGAPFPRERKEDFFNFCEWSHSEHACNVRINDFERLMKQLQSSLSMKIEKTGYAVKLSMKQDGALSSWASCVRIDEDSDTCFAGTFSDTQMVKILFGPERPSELPFVGRKGGILDTLFPLSFTAPLLDMV